jgi:predicted Ser/Thr protein kinase
MTTRQASTPGADVDIRYAQIHNPRLLLTARILWATIFLAAAVLAAAHLLSLPQAISDVLKSDLGALSDMKQLGVSTESLGLYAISLKLMNMFPFVFLALIVFYYRSNNWMALWLALTAVFLAMHVALFPSVAPVRHPLFGVNFFLAIASGMLLLYALPNGRFEPRWIWALFIPYLLWDAARVLQPSLLPLRFPLSTLPWTGIAIGAIVIQVRRYRNGSQVYRQQVKWFLLGVVIFFWANLLYGFVLFPLQSSLPIVRFFVLDFVGSTSFGVLGLGFAIAVARYRLYDVDLIINRSLVLSIVTFGLALVFGSSVLALQGLLGGANPAAAMVISSVGPVILFNPARKRAQHFVDRRLYGFRFDLNQVAAAQNPPEVSHPGALTGRTLGAYQVLGVLGKGGMGEVYQGYGNGQTVAIKVLPEDLSQNADLRKRFDREAKTLTAFDHPNIVKMYSYGESQGVHYMAMEYIEGQELGHIIKQRGRIPFHDARPFVNDFAAALDYAHDKGLVHRDIKPSNIMVRQKDDKKTTEAVLMDFGIAKIQDARTALTGSGAMGTIDYMAPEQIMTARAVDHRADIYALGVVLYEMLTGECPFKGSAGQVLFAHLQQPPPDPCDLVPDLPAHVARAVMKAMQKQPEERFQSVREFAGALSPA